MSPGGTSSGTAVRRRVLPTRTVVAAGALGAAALWPVQHAEDGPVLCPFRLATGLPCPACGLTRSFIYTLHGQPDDAFAAHLFGPPLVLLALVWLLLVSRGGAAWSDPSRWFVGRARPWAVAVAGAWLAYALGRMLTV